jgi:hypothetical protein
MIFCCLSDIFSHQKKERQQPHDSQLLSSVAISSFLTQSWVDFFLPLSFYTYWHSTTAMQAYCLL